MLATIRSRCRLIQFAQLDEKLVREQLASGRLHPRDAKANLAEREVRRFHGAPAAAAARRHFDQRFGRGELPLELTPVWESEEVLPLELSIPALLTRLGLTKSNSEARRLISQNAVRIGGQVFAGERYRTDTTSRSADGKVMFLLEVGKRRACRLSFVAPRDS